MSDKKKGQCYIQQDPLTIERRYRINMLKTPLKVKMPQGIRSGVWILSIGIPQWCGTKSEDPRSEALRKCMAFHPVESDGERTK